MRLALAGRRRAFAWRSRRTAAPPHSWRPWLSPAKPMLRKPAFILVAMAAQQGALHRVGRPAGRSVPRPRYGPDAKKVVALDSDAMKSIPVRAERTCASTGKNSIRNCSTGHYFNRRVMMKRFKRFLRQAFLDFPFSRLRARRLHHRRNLWF